MTSINEQLEREVYELLGNDVASNPLCSIHALEAACQILDHKFGKDFHRKNPKLAVRFAESILKNIRMNDLKDAIVNDIGKYLDSLKTAIKRNDSKARETIFEDYSDSFRF